MRNEAKGFHIVEMRNLQLGIFKAKFSEVLEIFITSAPSN